MTAISNTALQQGHRGWENMHKAPLLVEWLAASAYIKQQSQVWQAAKAFFKVLATHHEIPLPDVIQDLRAANGEVLRVARIKLDCVCSLLFRQVFAALPDHCDIFIYLDSSPQVRGEELFAASWEVFDPVKDSFVVSRRYMPLVALGRDFMDAAGKTLALLWLIFLLVGPAWQSMRRFCNMVKAVLTDMGTERLIHSQPDILPDYFELMHGINVGCPLQARMFPNSLSMPGWQHGWDLMLRRSLLSLPFFPSFIAGLRALFFFFAHPYWLTFLSGIS